MLRIKITVSRPAWLGHTVFGFCAAHDKSEPAREDASPPTRRLGVVARRRARVVAAAARVRTRRRAGGERRVAQGELAAAKLERAGKL